MRYLRIQQTRLKEERRLGRACRHEYQYLQLRPVYWEVDVEVVEVGCCQCLTHSVPLEAHSQNG